MNDKYTLYDVFSKKLPLTDKHIELLCSMFRIHDEYEKQRFAHALKNQQGKGKLSYKGIYEEILFND